MSHPLLEKLRSGSTAEIWRSELGGAAIAIKLLHAELGDDAHALASFRSEVALSIELDHPHIVRALEAGEREGRPYLAVEYLSGGALSDEPALGWRRAIALAKELASALVHLAERGIVHRDLSPDNVMLDAAGRAKLIDFGVASRTPESGTLAGNIAYSSPEQLEGRAVDARADVFSLGVLLHELVTGERLFRRATEAATLLAVCESPIPRASARRSDLPRELDDVLALALERDPERRPSAAELAARLAAIAR